MVMLFIYLFLTFNFVLEYNQLTVLWSFHINNEGSHPYIYMCPFSPRLCSRQTTIEHGSLCYIVDPYRLSILNIAVCTCPSQS